MRKIVVPALLVLAACSGPRQTASAPPVDLAGWRETAPNRAPTRAEMLALMATCQDRQRSGRGGSLDGCLTDLGLKRAR